MGYPQHAITAILLAFMAFGLYSAFADMSVEDSEALKAAIAQDPAGKGGAAACYALAFNSATPALQLDWLPPEGKLTPVLEDLPLFDTTDMFPLGLVVLITSVILKFTLLRNSPGVKQYLIAFLIVLAAMALTFLLLKLIAFLLMLSCGQELGFTKESILKARQEAIQAMSAAGAYWPTLLMSLFGALSLGKSVRWSK